MSDEAKIRKEGMKLIEEFSRMLEKIPETEETHYVVDLKNVTRKDGEITEGGNFSTNLKRIAPRWEEGYVVAEKGV